MRNVLRNNYPIKGILKNGTEIIFDTDIDLMTNVKGFEKCYKVIGDDIIISKKGFPDIILVKSAGIANIFPTFIQDDYNFLPIKGNVVLDIGANVGDSAISFVIKGASRVIALEPFPKNYEMARRNIEENGMSDKITIILSGLSNKEKTIAINPETQGTASETTEFPNGIDIPMLTLRNIITTYNIDSAILKMDCENCEYDVILSCPNDILQKFSHMVIEYHYGYKNLKKKLESAGFQVSVSTPICQKSVHYNKFMYYGYLYAKYQP